MMEKIKTFGCIVLALVIALSLVGCASNKDKTMTEMDYLEELDPMIKSFPSLDGIERCFWKDGRSGGRIGIGPTDYFMKGFLILSKEKKEELLNLYEWEVAEVDFTQEVDFAQEPNLLIKVNPEITGFSDFTWVYNEEFSEMVMSDLVWWGDVFLDPNNGILYFDVSTF